MYEHPLVISFHSDLGLMLENFIEERRALGYRCNERNGSNHYLIDLDRFLHQQNCPATELPRGLVDQWMAKRQHENPRTQKGRISILRQFALFLTRMEIPAYVPPCNIGSPIRLGFVARIFTREEVHRLISAIDALPRNNRARLRHLIMPELFRLLYGCGLRVGEALRLRVKDVDLNEGILTIYDGKFGKDRLVPLAPSMTERLNRYAITIGNRDGDDFFFPAPDRGRYHQYAIYTTFRTALRAAGISHEGKGRGPRVHDLRHSFAVHRFVQWYQEGADLSVKLPVLASYMGHRSLSGTQRYLQLTADLFPDLTARNEEKYGHIIPEGGPCDETD